MIGDRNYSDQRWDTPPRDSGRLMHLLFDWPKLEHYVRHDCGYIVPQYGDRACGKCWSGMKIETYEDIWVWT